MIYEVLIDFDPLTYGADVFSCGYFDTLEKANEAKEFVENLTQEDEERIVYVASSQLNRFKLFDTVKDF